MQSSRCTPRTPGIERSSSVSQSLASLECADYLERNFAVEDDIECRFGQPIVGGDRGVGGVVGELNRSGRRPHDGRGDDPALRR